ncbi:ULP-PROTEASE domain-containing protein [Fusarium keratoplasticum]|uniref:ULP-PROTEASE domain-containing protein n=1 Tax=Fusarium keratoplasticum TaxID=1328300 RepID=A0ACC0QAX4_9HYPO|nr:ULP-PROTEASE domain-containing protein [Fusarium keratoplasticum]KAI8648223.1 ULP-PROTEASE domain-containing protein [Fusarium keratoplasticum]
MTIDKLRTITRLATSNGVPLVSLWQSGGALRESLEGDPPKLTRNAVKTAIETLRQELLRRNPLSATPPIATTTNDSPQFPPAGPASASSEVSSVDLPDPDGGILDSDDDSYAVPEPTGIASSAKTLSTKILNQLQSEECLTDDVLYFLSAVVFARHRGLHPPDAQVYLKDPLWFDVDAPPSLPRCLFQDERPKDATIYMPALVDKNHWVLVRIVVKAGDATATIYDSLPSPARAKRLTAGVTRWFQGISPSLRVAVLFQICARQLDTVSCGIFVIANFDQILQGQSPSLQIEPRAERARLLEMMCVIETPLLDLDDEQLQAVSEVQAILCPPTTPSVQAGPKDAVLTAPIGPIHSVSDKDIKISTPTSSPTTSPTKRHTPNTADLMSLASQLVQSITDRTRDRKVEKVGAATCHLNDANTTLSKAEAVLKEAQDALEQGKAIESSSSDNRAAFQHWLSQAPIDTTGGPFGFAIQGATQSARAFLAQYLSTVRESMVQLVDNAADAVRQVDESKAIVEARQQELKLAMEDKGSHESDLQQLGSLLGRLLE